MLQMPVQVVTWILKNDYINGTEFTMGGKKMRLELVDCPEEPQDKIPEEQELENSSDTKKGEQNAKVISFNDLKKNSPPPTTV